MIYRRLKIPGLGSLVNKMVKEKKNARGFWGSRLEDYIDLEF